MELPGWEWIGAEISWSWIKMRHLRSLKSYYDFYEADGMWRQFRQGKNRCKSNYIKQHSAFRELQIILCNEWNINEKRAKYDFF